MIHEQLNNSTEFDYSVQFGALRYPEQRFIFNSVPTDALLFFSREKEFYTREPEGRTGLMFHVCRRRHIRVRAVDL